MNSILKLENISKHYSGLKVLQKIDLKIPEGKIFGLIGPNGAGKTTLFNIICGMVQPNSGSIYFEGNPITSLSTDQRARLQMGRTFQITRPFLELTCLENVRVGLETTSLTQSQKLEQAQHHLSTLGLSDKASLLAKNLSLMEKKKLELARALSIQPKLLLLDEFMSGLNPTEVNEASQLIQRLNQDFKITILWIEHLIRAVSQIAHQSAVLHQGIILREGTPQEVLQDPRVIEAYIGSEP